jgi:hypothetical protein
MHFLMKKINNDPNTKIRLNFQDKKNNAKIDKNITILAY